MSIVPRRRDESGCPEPRRRNATARLSLSLVTGITVLVLLTGWSDASWASRKMRCGNSLISKGAYQEQVLARCGAPYSSRGDYWLYRVRNVVFRLHFNRQGRVSWIKSEIVY